MEKNTLQKALEAQGYECRSYSGRFMYGKTCLAFVTDDSLLSIGFALGKSKFVYDIDEYDLERMRQDSMGLSIVYYFPGVPYTENKNNFDYDEEEDAGED